MLEYIGACWNMWLKVETCSNWFYCVQWSQTHAYLPAHSEYCDRNNQPRRVGGQHRRRHRFCCLKRMYYFSIPRSSWQQSRFKHRLNYFSLGRVTLGKAKLGYNRVGWIGLGYVLPDWNILERAGTWGVVRACWNMRTEVGACWNMREEVRAC